MAVCVWEGGCRKAHVYVGVCEGSQGPGRAVNIWGVREQHTCLICETWSMCRTQAWHNPDLNSG